jgi:putative protease
LKMSDSTLYSVREAVLPPLPELLSPAGSPEALEAAVLAGADAVYLGAPSFNARIHAHNFGESELASGIAFAHRYGVRVYVTLNTLIFDRELPDLLRVAESVAKSGADGLIVADMGAAALVHKAIPSLPLHASTQASGHGQGMGQLLSNYGFSRFVMARESSREDIRSAVLHSGMEVEVFVHGALCVCHSGQCLFSSIVGGRSGNRGECAQPCRLPYSAAGKSDGEGYPLSLKDLSLARHIPALIEDGVASLKIEGRMKHPDYVRTVTSVFRRLLDERRGATDDEMRLLSDTFSRGGFTDGYYTKKVGNAMLGVRSDADKQRTLEVKTAPVAPVTLPVGMQATIKAGCPLSLAVTAPLWRWRAFSDPTPATVTVAAVGMCPEVARTAPLHEAGVRQQLTKTGGTPYRVGDFGLSLDEGLMVPVSALNQLRREALSALEEEQARLRAPFRLPSDPSVDAEALLQHPDLLPIGTRQDRRTATFEHPEQITSAAADFFSIVYLPLHRFVARPTDHAADYGVIMPPVIPDNEAEEVQTALINAFMKGAGHILVTNQGQLPLIQNAFAASGLRKPPLLHGDWRLNVTNSATVAFLESVGLLDTILSPELTLPRIRDVKGDVSAIVYGRLPLMLLEKCVMQSLMAGKKAPDRSVCSLCAGGSSALKDRMGVVFPLLRLDDTSHRNILLNSRPLSMTDRAAELAQFRVTAQHFLFTTESKDEVDAVIDAAKNDRPLSAEVRRISKK